MNGTKILLVASHVSSKLVPNLGLAFVPNPGEYDQSCGTEFKCASTTNQW